MVRSMPKRVIGQGILADGITCLQLCLGGPVSKEVVGQDGYAVIDGRVVVVQGIVACGHHLGAGDRS